MHVGAYVRVRYHHYGNVPPTYYPGIVTEVNGNKMRVAFDNGDTSHVHFKGVRRVTWMHCSAEKAASASRVPAKRRVRHNAETEGADEPPQTKRTAPTWTNKEEEKEEADGCGGGHPENTNQTPVEDKEEDAETAMSREYLKTDEAAGGARGDVHAVRMALPLMRSMLQAASERVVPRGTRHEVLAFVMSHVLRENEHCHLGRTEHDPDVWLELLESHTPASFGLLEFTLRECWR